MKKISNYILAFFAASTLFSSCKFKQREPIKNYPVTLRFAENHVTGYPTTLADEEFARLVEEKTEGRVKIEVKSGGALTETSAETIEALKNGDIAFSRVSVSPLTSYVPKFSVLQLPYIFTSSTHQWNVLNGKLGQDLLSELEISGSGLVGLCYYDSGARNFYSTKAIKSIEDLKDLRIRAQGAMTVDMVEALGAVAVTGITMSEVRQNLESGTIDAAENNWPTYQSTNDYTAAKYYVLDQHSRIPEVLAASKKALSRISPEDVAIIKEVAKQIQDYEIQQWKEKELDSEQIVRRSGTIVIELPAHVQKEFQDAMQPLYDKYASQYKSILKEIQSTK